MPKWRFDEVWGIHDEFSPIAPEEQHPQTRFNMMAIRVNRTLLPPLAQTWNVSAKDSVNSVSIGNFVKLFALTRWRGRFISDAQNTQIQREITNRVYLLIVDLKGRHNSR